MDKPKVNLKDTFIVGIIKENPVFVMLLSLCPVLGVSSSFVTSVSLGALMGVVTVFTSLVVSALSRIIPSEIRIPVIVTIVATSVTILEMTVHAFLPDLYSALGIFLSLIVVNCMVFGRAEAFAMKNRVLASVLDALGMTFGTVLAFAALGLVREILGTGALNLFGLYLRIFPEVYAVPLFIMPAGAFIVLGVMVGIVFTIKAINNDKAAAKLKAAKAAA